MDDAATRCHPIDIWMGVNVANPLERLTEVQRRVLGVLLKHTRKSCGARARLFIPFSHHSASSSMPANRGTV